MKIEKLLVTQIACCVFCLAGLGETYYVNTTSGFANDAWSKTQNSEAAPWKTIQHAVNQAAANDTIMVHAGTYQENVSIAVTKPGLRLIGYNSDPTANLDAGTAVPKTVSDFANAENKMPVVSGGSGGVGVLIQAANVDVKNCSFADLARASTFATEQMAATSTT